MAATMKDIARRTGLGLATISKFFNGGQVRPKNRKLIEDAARELHFIPNEFARSLKTSQSKTIGVLIPELGNAFITSIITTMEDILRKQDYGVLVCDCRSDPKIEREAVTFLVHKRVDGLINMATDATGAHLAPALENGVPVVLVDRMIKSLTGQVSAVIVDNVNAAERATNYLLDAGHTRIALILGNAGIYTTEKRREGFLNAMRERGVTPCEDFIHYSDYTIEGGYATMKSILAQPDRPTAAFITNNEMTLGALMALNELGLRAPDDISLMAFDKLDIFSAILPNLTLMKQPQNAIGECVARQMLTLLSEPNASALHQIVSLSVQLQEGGSVGRATRQRASPSGLLSRG